MREKEIEEITATLAKEKAAVLATYRREEAIKQVEEKMALQRSQRIEERRKKAAAVLKVIQGEDLVLSGMQEGYLYQSLFTWPYVFILGGYDMPSDINNVQFVIDACNRLMKDLLECRQKLIEAIKRQNSVQEKTEIFRKQVSQVQDEERRLRRAIRLIEINPSILGKDVSAANEIDGLKRSLSSKEETLLELLTLSHQREQQLDAANRSAQLLKVALKERDELMSTRIKDLDRVQHFLAESIKKLKTEREVLVIEKDKIRLQEVATTRRMQIVEKELLRIKGHKGVNVDTDVWMEGVMQRCITKDLKKHLKQELKQCAEKFKSYHIKIENVRVNQFDITEKVAKLKRDCDKISAVKSLFFKAFQNFHASPIGQLLASVSEMHTQADLTEQRRLKEKNHEIHFSSHDNNDIVEKIRYKESDLRSKEERKFVAIDLVLNPEAYLHVTVVEAEQMQFDDDYHCFFSKSDLTRIMNLPNQINLALPFLNTADEIDAHRLINKFLRGLDENVLKNKDKYGHTGKDEDAESLEVQSSKHTLKNNSLVDFKNLQDAEVIHDILVRESCRDRIRAVAKDEQLTDDEAKWINLDKILSPHVYDSSELPNPLHPIVDKRSLDQTLKISMSKTKTVNPRPGGKPKDRKYIKNEELSSGMTDGNIYNELRSQYDDGFDMFDEEYWICPFNREDLLKIRQKPSDQLISEDEITCRRLLDKYYVDDNESILGYSRLQSLNEISKKLSQIVQRYDNIATEELFHISQEFNGKNNSTLTQNEIEMEKHNESEKEKNISRVWGSWNQVHPGSAGKESQTEYFKISSYNPNRDHPASFALHNDDDVDSDLSDEETVVSPQSGAVVETIDRRKLLGIQSLTHSIQKQSTKKLQVNNNNHHNESKVYISESIDDLAKQNARKLRGKSILMAAKEKAVIFSIKDAFLNSRQSRSHYFTLPHDKHILDVTVSVVFQGDFGGKGYKLGRIAVGLFRLPVDNETSVPYPVGYAPYEMQSPNMPTSMGKILIVHKPHHQPIPHGTFQIVIGAASNTKYSVEVSSK